MPRYSIELSLPDSVFVCDRNGQDICRQSAFGKALADCRKSGDCEDACRYLLTTFKPEFNIVRKVDGAYANIPACHEEKAAICRSIYFESETNFTADEEMCNIYLIWEASHVDGD